MLLACAVCIQFSVGTSIFILIVRYPFLIYFLMSKIKLVVCTRPVLLLFYPTFIGIRWFLQYLIWVNVKSYPEFLDKNSVCVCDLASWIVISLIFVYSLEDVTLTITYYFHHVTMLSNICTLWKYQWSSSFICFLRVFSNCEFLIYSIHWILWWHLHSYSSHAQSKPLCTSK